MTDLHALGILAVRTQCACGKRKFIVTAVLLRLPISFECPKCGTVMEFTPT